VAGVYFLLYYNTTSICELWNNLPYIDSWLSYRGNLDL
jgi:hypothetical protein